MKGAALQESPRIMQESYEIMDPSEAIDELSKHMVKKDFNDHTNEIHEKYELMTDNGQACPRKSDNDISKQNDTCPSCMSSRTGVVLL